MIVSWDWLRQYVDLDMSEETLVSRLMMAGLNHESTTEVDGDIVIDLEVTSNRPDCLGHIGIAREVAVLFDRLLKVSPTNFEESATDVETKTSIEIDSSAENWCPQYRGRLIEGVKVGPSPAWMQRRLKSLGMRPVNNVVDITNYILMECGQPLHAFDFDKLTGRRIIVRDAQPGEKLIAIDGSTCELRSGMGVIADAERPVAVAGVMGGLDSEVSSKTTTIFLESAEFSPLAIRRASRALDLRSESSYRFERKIDPAGVAWASDRACHLLATLAGGKVAQGALHVGREIAPTPRICLRFERVERILGLSIDHGLCTSILEKLGCLVDKAEPGPFCFVEPPSWRRDLVREIDLVEEVGRVHGYEAVSQDRVIPLTVAPVRRETRVLQKARQVLMGAGYFEAMTFSFTHEKSIEAIRPWSQEHPIVLHHSSRKHENRLRQSLLPSLVEAIRLNETRGNENVHLFEVAPIYLPKEKESLPNEPRVIGLASTGDIRTVQGVVEAIFERLGIHATFQPKKIVGLEAGQSAEYLVEGAPIAIVGNVAAGVRQAIDLRAPVAVAEILLPPLVTGAKLAVSVQPLPDQPAMVRDLAVVVDESIPWRRLEEVVRSSAGTLLERLEFVDLFRGKQIEAGKKSLALRMTFRAPDRTLTREEIDGQVSQVVDQLKQDVGGVLRA